MKRILFILSLFYLTASPLTAAETFKVLLVSIEEYKHAPLDFARQDTEKFSSVLTERYGCELKKCIDRAGSGDTSPKNSIETKIEEWCNVISDDDTALLYLAGHGVKDGDGKLYLAMVDFDSQNFETAAIPFDWIREQFGSSKGKSKLLLVDTCFAGTAKDMKFRQATSGEVCKVFANLSNVATIASSQADERSWLWPEMKHSLFTYWVIEAFKGHAVNKDRKLTFEGLAEYLKENVPVAAQAALEQSQNPAVLNADAGKNFNLSLQAVSLKVLIDDIAEQIDLQMRMHKYTQIGIPVFTSGEPKFQSGNLTIEDTKAFNPSHGILPNSVSSQLREKLALKCQKNRSGYKIISETFLREILESNGITPEDLGGGKTKNLKLPDGSELLVLVCGQITLLGKIGVSLQTELLHAQEVAYFGKTGGTAWLSGDDIVMTGVSDALDKYSIVNPATPPRVTEPLKPVPYVGDVPAQRVQEAQRIQEAEQRRGQRKEQHPIADKELPFTIWFEVRPINRPNAPYEKRDHVIDGNNCYLPLSKGEEYQIIMRTTMKDGVFARVLVDGQNTLSQPKMTAENGMKGAYVEAVDRGVNTLAPRVSLTDARAWHLKPKTLYKVSGFYDVKNMNDAKLHRFQIVDADESVTSRKNYAEQLGWITIGFYREQDEEKGGKELRSAPGDPEPVPVPRYKDGKVPGQRLAVYNIRYLTPEALKKITKK